MIGDDAEVLRFRGRADRDDEEPYGRGWVDQGWGHEAWGEDLERRVPGVLDAGTDRLTTVVLVGDRVVDVVRRPVRGSDYERAALEIEDERRRVAPPPPTPPGHELQLAWLARVVGGSGPLASLDALPLPAEELLLDEVPAGLHGRARDLQTRVDASARTLFGDEGVTAARRLLTRLLVVSPASITRGERDDVTAGALVWAVAKGNDLVGQGRPITARTLQAVCGLTSSPASRGSTLAHAVGGGAGEYSWTGYYGRERPDVLPLGDPGLLLGAFRRRLILLRDLALDLRAHTPSSH